MKELDNFTVERLEEILNFDLPRHPATLAEIVALVRIALAAKRAEPVAYITYKGYLIHAGDPRLSEYSEPEPLYDAPQLNSSKIPEGYVIITRDMLADYRDIKNAEVESCKAGFAGYYEQEGTRWARVFEDLCEELMAIDDALAAQKTPL
jgi:hypothetical protein